VVTSTDSAYRDLLSEIHGISLELLTYEGTKEEKQLAQDLLIKATNTWPYEEDSEEDSPDDEEAIHYLEPPSTMTHIEMEFCAETTTNMGLEFYPLNMTKTEILAF
jgi:hypothetical protein